jgi:hypothetical protein
MRWEKTPSAILEHVALHELLPEAEAVTPGEGIHADACPP